MEVGYKTRWLAVALGVLLLLRERFAWSAADAALPIVALPFFLTCGAVVAKHWPRVGEMFLVGSAFIVTYMAVAVHHRSVQHVGPLATIYSYATMLCLLALDVALIWSAISTGINETKGPELAISSRTRWIAAVTSVAVWIIPPLGVLCLPLMLGALIGGKLQRLGTVLMTSGAFVLSLTVLPLTLATATYAYRQRLPVAPFALLMAIPLLIVGCDAALIFAVRKQPQASEEPQLVSPE